MAFPISSLFLQQLVKVALFIMATTSAATIRCICHQRCRASPTSFGQKLTLKSRTFRAPRLLTTLIEGLVATSAVLAILFSGVLGLLAMRLS